MVQCLLLLSAIVLGLTLGAIWALLPDYMKPGKSLFGLTVTIIMSLAAEQLVVRIPTPKNLPPLPPLLGECFCWEKTH